jgi:hypothetical protein
LLASIRLEDKICTKERRDAQDIFKQYRDGAVDRDRNRLAYVRMCVRSLRAGGELK